MGRIVNLDGELLAPEQARISVFDRGFLYGDSVYEVVRTYNGKPFELEAHLDRLERSAQLVALKLPWARERLAGEVLRTLRAAGSAESYLRLVVTRGAGEIGLDPALAHGGTVVLIARELSPPAPEVYENGIAVAIVGVRRNLREALDPAAKTGNYLNNVLALKQARDLGASDALMLDRDGRITEAPQANLFLVRGGALFTPPLQVGILEGVTRRVVLRLAREAGLAASEQQLLPEEVLAADELFLTATTRELVPVTQVLEGATRRRVGSGRPGPLTRRLHADFRAYAQRACPPER